MSAIFCSGRESLRFLVEDVVYVSCLKGSSSLAEGDFVVSAVTPAADSTCSGTLSLSEGVQGREELIFTSQRQELRGKW